MTCAIDGPHFPGSLPDDVVRALAALGVDLRFVEPPDLESDSAVVTVHLKVPPHPRWNPLPEPFRAGTPAKVRAMRSGRRLYLAQVRGGSGVAWLLGAAIAGVVGGELRGTDDQPWVRVTDLAAALDAAWRDSGRRDAARFEASRLADGPPVPIPAPTTDGVYEFAHPGGARWTLRADGPRVTIEFVDPSGSRRLNERAVPDAHARARLIAEGRNQMVKAGYSPSDGRLAAARAARDAALKAFVRPLPRALKRAVACVASRAFERELEFADEHWSTVGWQAGLAGAPRARDALIRHYAGSAKDVSLAVELAAFSRSPLLEATVEVGQHHLAVEAEQRRAMGAASLRPARFGAPWWEGARALGLDIEHALAADPPPLSDPNFGTWLTEALDARAEAVRLGTELRAGSLWEFVLLASAAEGDLAARS